MFRSLPMPEGASRHLLTQKLHNRLIPRLVSFEKNVTDALPPELLCEIFLKLLEDDDRDLQSSNRPLVSRACQSDPLLFGHVCSYWRSVALHSPQLWSRIYILNPQRAQLPLTRLWLKRAGTYPLDLSIWATEQEEYDQPTAKDIMSLFGDRRQYWKSIYFAVEPQILQFFSDIVTSSPSLHLLESATLWISGESDRASELNFLLDGVWKVVHACKTLTYVDWRTFYCHTLPEHCPWNQLSGLTLSSTLSYDQLLYVLTITPLLESLRCHALVSATPNDCDTRRTHEQVIHLRLKILNISSNEETGPLFRFLALPALRVLKIRNNFRTDVPRDIATFNAFLVRSQSEKSLKVFEMIDLRIDEADLQKYIKSPGLRNLLHVKFASRITDEVVNLLAMTKQNGIPEVIPSLQALDISTSSLRTTDGALSTMVASRFSASNDNGRLKRFASATRSLGLKDQRALSILFSQGLEGR